MTTPLRILTVTGIYPTAELPYKGTFVESDVLALREAGHSVDVIHPAPGLPRALRYLSAAARVLRAVASRRYDVVHGHYGVWCAVARLYWRAPLICTFHGDDVLGTPSGDGGVTFAAAPAPADAGAGLRAGLGDTGGTLYYAWTGKLALTTLLTRIMLPFLTLIAIGVAMMGMLNALHRFFVPSLSPAMFNVGTLLAAGVTSRAFLRRNPETVKKFLMAMVTAVHEFKRNPDAAIAVSQSFLGVKDVANARAAYEAYRARLKADPEGRANFEFAQRERFILREQRTFTEAVDEAFLREPA